MDSEEARRRFENEGILVILNIPSSGLHITTDGSQAEVMVNDKFKGFKMISCHVPHLITLRPLPSHPDTDSHLSHSSFHSLFAIFKPKEILVLEWITDEEVFRISGDDDLIKRLYEHRHDLDQFMAAYSTNAPTTTAAYSSLLPHLDVDTFGKMFKRGHYLFSSLSDLNEAPNSFPFTPIPNNRELLASGTLTSLHDKSALLSHLFPSFNSFLAELECSYVMAIVCLNFACISQWTSLVTLLSSSPLFIENNSESIDAFLSIILRQLDPSIITSITYINVDDFKDLITDCDATHKLFGNLKCILQESPSLWVTEELKDLLRREYGFIIDFAVLEDEDDAPVCAQLNL